MKNPSPDSTCSQIILTGARLQGMKIPIFPVSSLPDATRIPTLSVISYKIVLCQLYGLHFLKNLAGQDST